MKEYIPEWMDVRAWRKFKQAEKNMVLCIRERRKRRRFVYWAYEMTKWVERIGI